MRSEDQRQEAYDRLMRGLAPCVLQSPWTPFSEHNLFSDPVRDPERLLRELSEDLLEDVVLAIGIAKKSGTGELVPDELLTQRTQFLVIRDEMSGWPSEVLSPIGPLDSSIQPPLTAVARKETILLQDCDSAHIVIASSLDDVAVLRACGIPGTLCCPRPRARAAGSLVTCPSHVPSTAS